MIFNLGSALLDACVLSVLLEKDTYGYELTQEIKEIAELSESTLYPVLRRLQKDYLLETYDEPVNGRNRRYYKITDKGKQKLCEYKDEWQRYKSNLDKVLERGKADE
ncbi:MAG: PadR family transcriptional regulator [Clostridia bacterium]